MGKLLCEIHLQTWSLPRNLHTDSFGIFDGSHCGRFGQTDPRLNSAELKCAVLTISFIARGQKMPPFLSPPLSSGREGAKEGIGEGRSYLIYTRLFKSPREFLTESLFVIRAGDNIAARHANSHSHPLLSSLSTFRQRCRSRAAAEAAAGCRKVSKGWKGAR